MKLQELVGYLDTYLSVSEVPDWPDAYNGLQVEGRRPIQRVAFAVDACLATITRASERGADLLIVHHGLFWGAKAPVTGIYYRRLETLMKNDIALYACHLPLDAHPEVGNNAVLARMLGLERASPFGEIQNFAIGVWCETEMTRADLVMRIDTSLNTTTRVIAAGPDTVRKVGIVTGAAGSQIADAAAFGLDTFLTGEGAHHTYFEAEERGINVLYAGHYATETVGVRALAEHLSRRFGLEVLLIDHPTGM